MVSDDQVYVREILDHIVILEQFLNKVSKQDFFDDLEKQFAVARALEILGEASAKLSESFRLEHTEIDWRGLKAMRNLLIHEYAYVDAEEIWKAWEKDLPDLKQKMLALN